MKDQEVIKKDIVDSIYWDTRVDASDIGVQVQDGEVTLTGTVPDYIAYQAAEDDARLIEGVFSVKNLINLKYPEGLILPTDGEIAANIKQALLAHSSIDGAGIDVNVKDGVVTLTGSVDTYWKKFRTEEIAYGMRGVISVVNKLTVVPTKRLTDEAIAENIRTAFERNILIDPASITVRVENGAVTLSGEASSWLEIREAENIAFYTPGVLDVSNTLLLGGQT